MSTTTAPSDSASAIPSPSTASCTTAPSGSMVMTASRGRERARLTAGHRAGLLGEPQLNVAIGVPDHEFVARPSQVRGHRPAHPPEADESDRLSASSVSIRAHAPPPPRQVLGWFDPVLVEKVRDRRERLGRSPGVSVDLLALPRRQGRDRYPGAVDAGRVDRARKRVEFGGRVGNEMRGDRVDRRLELGQQRPYRGDVRGDRGEVGAAAVVVIGCQRVAERVFEYLVGPKQPVADAGGGRREIGRELGLRQLSEEPPESAGVGLGGTEIALGPEVELDPVEAGEAGVGRPQRVAGGEAVDLAAELDRRRRRLRRPGRSRARSGARSTRPTSRSRDSPTRSPRTATRPGPGGSRACRRRTPGTRSAGAVPR